MNGDHCSSEAEVKRAALASILQKKIEPSSRHRLSLAQKRLWVRQQLDLSSPVFNISVAYRLEGPLDVEALQFALQASVAKHASLRTSFPIQANEPLQVVTPRLNVPLELTDVDVDDEVDLEDDTLWPAAIDQLARKEAATPFDLAQCPLWRFRIFRWRPNRYAFLLTVHHMVADRWSLGILAQDISSFYCDFLDVRRSSDRMPAKNRVPREVVNDVKIDDEQLSRDGAFWRDNLQQLPRLQLPGERMPSPDRAHARSHHGERHVFCYTVDTVNNVTAFCQNEGCTTFVALLAAFAVLNFQWTGQADQTICVPVTGRHRARTKNVVGYFNNILPVRIKWTGNPTFRELVIRVGHAVRLAYEHQEMPFQQVAETLDKKTTSLTRCLFSLQNTQSLIWQLPDVCCDYQDVPNGTADFDLSVFLEERTDRLLGIVDYKSDLFDETTIKDIFEQYRDTLETLAKTPDRSLDSVSNSSAARKASAKHQAPLVKSSPCGETSGSKSLPRTELERQLIDIWEKTFNETPLSPEADFFELGGDSLTAARLFENIQATFDRHLPLATILSAHTIREMGDAIGSQAGMDSWASLVPIQPNGDRPKFFLVHGGGGNVLTYRHLANRLAADQPVYGLQSRGLDGREPVLQSVEEMADHYLESVLAIEPNGPYRLGGHSLGAVIALEMAQRLSERGHVVDFLALFDHPGPDARPTFGHWLRVQQITLSQLQWREKLNYLWRGVRWRINSQRRLPPWVRKCFGAIIRGGNRAQASRRVELLENSLKALGAYTIKPYPGRISLFRAKQGPPRIHADPYGGWSSIAQDGVDVYGVAGDHMTMFAEPNIVELADAVDIALARVSKCSVEARITD